MVSFGVIFGKDAERFFAPALVYEPTRIEEVRR